MFSTEKNWFGSWTEASEFNHWIVTISIFVIALIIGYAIRKMVWARLRRVTSNSSATWDDLIVDQLSVPAGVLVFIASFGIAAQSAPLSVREHPLLRFGTKVALILVAFWVLERFITLFFKSSALPADLTTTTRTLFATITRALLLTIGFLVVLDTVGISITPVLASLGVGSVAVALALQDTLSNFFGGLYLLVDKPIRIGDFVEVEGVEGHVEHIGWRSTRVRMLSNIAVTLPNSSVASSKLKNYDLPISETGIVFQMGVAYGSDLEKVERVTIEVAKEIIYSKLENPPEGFEPFIRYHTFADSSINFSVILRVKTYTDNFILKHEFIKAVHARYIKEGIEIPFPQRVLHVPQSVQVESKSLGRSSQEGRSQSEQPRQI